jgi:hypothetical protein
MTDFDPRAAAREAFKQGHKKPNGNGAARPGPRIWTSAELLAETFPEPRYLIPGVLPEGLTILAGRPKLGKSWLAFDFGIAVAGGGLALGSVACQPAGVLILSMEDSPRRAKGRLRTLRAIGNTNLSVATQWERMNEGGFDRIRQHLDQNPHCRFVVGDTLARLRPHTSKMRDAYQADCEALEPLQVLASERNIGILAVTHTRKTAADDWLDAVGGTSGITGTADSIMVLKRERGQADAFLFGDGRDMPDYELPLRFDKATCRWSKLEMTAAEAHATSDQAAIIKLLRSMNGAGLLRSQIAAALDRSKQAISNMLRRMEDAGIVEVKGNLWRLTV